MNEFAQYQRAIADLGQVRGELADALGEHDKLCALVEQLRGFVTEEVALAANRLMDADYPKSSFEELVLAQQRDAQLAAGAIVQARLALEASR